MYFAAASRCALTKFSYSSFGVLVSVFFFVVFRICFLILIRIYLLYLCCLIGPSHSVWWSLFVWRSFVGLTVFSPWLFGGRWTHLQKRSMPRKQNTRLCKCNTLHLQQLHENFSCFKLERFNYIEDIQWNMIAHLYIILEVLWPMENSLECVECQVDYFE